MSIRRRHGRQHAYWVRYCFWVRYSLGGEHAAIAVCFGESLREPLAAGGVVLPQVTQEESALLDRGAQISQRQCAGCHEMATLSSAPSYQEIVAFYRREFPPAAGNSELRARLASAVTHPRPGWGNFAPGPLESALSLDDRIAVADWILSNFQQEKEASEGAGK